MPKNCYKRLFSLGFTSFLFFLRIGSYECLLTDYYVSVTTGSNNWDGSYPTHTPDTNSGPWASLPYAIAEIRKLRPNPPTSTHHVNLNILSGIYFLSETLTLNKQDSFMTWKGDFNTIISGGIQIASVPTKTSKDVQHITFEGSCGEAFIGNHRLIPARSPNIESEHEEFNNNIAEGPYHTIKNLLVETPNCKRDSKAYKQSCPDEDRYGFIMDNDLYSPDWQDVEKTNVLIFHSWIAEFAKVSNITRDGSDWKVLFQSPLKHAPVGQYVKSSGWRFLFYNNLALLDEPGEYVCIKRGENMAEFSYIPPTQEKHFVNDIYNSVIVSQLDILIFMSSTNNITMNNLKFWHTSSKGVDGYNWGTHNTVKIRSSSDIVFKKCEFSHVGTTGIFMVDASRISISHNRFTDIGYHGLMIMYKSISEQTRDITIDNNIFKGCGMNNFWQPNGLWVGGYENITVRNNEISLVPYAGIRIHSLMPHGGSRDRYDPVYHLEYNDIHSYGLGILNDFGGVYITVDNVNCDKLNEADLIEHCSVYSHVYNNRIRIGTSFDNGANSLYSDVSSCRNTFENNVMYGLGGNPLYHHCGMDNLSKNNVIHRTSINFDKAPEKSFETVWAGCGTSDHERAQSYENEKNIYLLDDIDGFHFGRLWDRYYNSSPAFHHNLYWSLAPGDTESAILFPDNLNWYQWQDTGNDTDSLWQDPLFEDPLNHVYLLKENSPAWSLGITQIDLDHFGVQESHSPNQIIHRMKH